MNLIALIPTGQQEITVNGLHQWDYGRKLEIHLDKTLASVEVHFACAGMDEAVVRVCEAVEGVAVATIPDKCLEQTTPITAWVYEIDGTTGLTTKKITLPIIARTRPSVGEDIPVELSNAYTEAVTAMNEAVAKLSEGGVKVSNAVWADVAGLANNSLRAEEAKTATSATHATQAITANAAENALHASTADKATSVGMTEVVEAAPVDEYGEATLSSNFLNTFNTLYAVEYRANGADGTYVSAHSGVLCVIDSRSEYYASLGHYKLLIKLGKARIMDYGMNNAPSGAIRFYKLGDFYA